MARPLAASGHPPRRALSFNRSSRPVGSLADNFLGNSWEVSIGTYYRKLLSETTILLIVTADASAAPSLLLQMMPASVVSWKTAPSLALTHLVLGICQSFTAGCRRQLDAHRLAGPLRFDLLPSLAPIRLRKRLPALSREINRLPCDTVAKTGRPDGTALQPGARRHFCNDLARMTWPTLADSVWIDAAPASTSTVSETAPHVKHRLQHGKFARFQLDRLICLS